MYIFFDALDEDRREFLTLLKQTHGWGIGTLHLLATSRREEDIAKVMSTLVSRELFIDESLVDGDIRIHVSETLDHDKDFERYSAEKRMIKSALTEGAHGM